MTKLFSMERFSDWLLNELNSRKMSQSDLARLAGLGSGTISNIMSGTRKVGQDTLAKIATALHLPPETVFRAAGLLPPVPELDGLRAEIINETNEMSREEQREILNYIRYRKSLEKKQQNAPGGNLANNLAK